MTISTLSFNTSTRTSLQRLQTQVNEASQELNSGRYVDVGKTLGRLTGASVIARAQETSFKELQDSNSLVANRIKNIDASLEAIAEGSESLANSLLASGVSTEFTTLTNIATSGLQQLTGALNASSDGQYLFGGANTDTVPLTTFEGSTVQTTVASDFAAFVLASTGATSPGAVTADDLTLYLGSGYTDSTGTVHAFSNVFDDATWASEWSAASDDTIASKISKTETIVSSATANEDAFKDTISAYVMVSELGIGSLSSTARQALTTIATTKLKNANLDITALRADVGTKLARIDASNAELQRQEDIAAATVSGLEEVDITEVGLRINAYETQLEAAYTVTGRLQNLSLLNYI